MIKEITIELKNKEIQISVEEARVLLSELKELFGENTYNPWIDQGYIPRQFDLTPSCQNGNISEMKLGPNNPRKNGISTHEGEIRSDYINTPSESSFNYQEQNIINPNKIIKEVKLEKGIGE